MNYWYTMKQIVFRLTSDMTGFSFIYFELIFKCYFRVNFHCLAEGSGGTAGWEGRARGESVTARVGGEREGWWA